jgi:anti-anti-sigma regulatory factor
MPSSVGDEQAFSPGIRVRTGLGDARRPVTLIQVLGAHAYESRWIVRSALADVHGHLVLDLTDCTFLDESVLAAIIRKAATLRDEGVRLELVVPATATFASRTVERLGIRTVVPVLASLPLGLLA